jgi:hypothetical protein
MPMTRTDRESLLKVCRLRAKVAKADVAALGAERKAEFERQLATIYSFDDDAVWKQAMAEAAAAARDAQKIVEERCKRLGIPREFAPEISGPDWYSRGENAVAERRGELRKVAYTKIEQLSKEANAEIDRRSAETQTNLLAIGLDTEQAKAYLEAMPGAAQLLPAVRVEDLQKQLGFARQNDDEEE